MSYQVILKYPVMFITAMLTTLILTPLVRKGAVWMGWVDVPGGRRMNTRPVPRLGGLAVFAGMHAACAVIFLLPWREFSGYLNLDWWLKFLVVSGFITGVGAVDDMRGVKPLVKLAGQFVAALGAFLLDMRFGAALGVDLPWFLDLVLTVLWILAITNAFNLIDGMDGLASGLALIASAGMAGGLLLQHLPADVLVLLGLIGACAAFLRYNFHPASIFLGDSGSMFLGFSLAVIALSTGSKGTAMASIGVPLLAVGIPLFDTILAVWRRFVRGLVNGGEEGAGIMSADKEHLHHRLIRQGLSQRRAATIIYVLSGLLIGVALLGQIYRSGALGIYLIAFVAGCYAVVKHLARVELWDSGSALLDGLRRPSGKVLAVILYPVLDVLIMCGALALALWLARPENESMALKDIWLKSFPGWVGISFIALFLARTYQRVWSRSRLCDLLIVMAALVLGVLVSTALAVVDIGELDKDLILLAIVYLGLILPAVTGIRVLSRALQDMLIMSAWHPSLNRSGGGHNVLIYGAGDAGTLFLRYRSAKFPALNDARRVVGLLDDDTNLHGRMVYGFPVLGGLARAREILKKRGVKEIVLTAGLPPGRLAELRKLAEESDVRVTEWRVMERAWHGSECS